MKEFRKYLSITIFTLSVIDLAASVLELVESVKLEKL
ncbi:Uncharacterised protein [Mycobacteroides abscessus subsp. abscessus]|nr:membrane protein [Mycobacterium phage prophi86-1]SLJ44956.1 Uncharacterised protein [Mycobacteroides abscessus subsp. abscessus]